MNDQPMDGRPAGFYPDPQGDPRERWWSGTEWTDTYSVTMIHTRRRGEPAAHPVLIALLFGIGVGLGGLFIAFMIGANQPDAEAAQANAGVAVAAARAAGVAGIVVAVATYVRLRRR